MYSFGVEYLGELSNQNLCIMQRHTVPEGEWVKYEYEFEIQCIEHG